MLLGKRVKEVGASKGRAVMARIRVQSFRSHPARKRADFQLVFGHEIVCVIFEGWKANERAVYVCTDRRTDAMARNRLGQGIRLRKKNANPYREGDSGNWRNRVHGDMGLLKGLSRMPGNWHVRFLGGGTTATWFCYPTTNSVS